MSVVVAAAFLTGATLAMLFAVLVDRHYPRTKTTIPHPCEASHYFVTIDAQPFQGQTALGPSTSVLKFCRGCEQHHVFILAGTWTLETLLLKESVAVSEVAKLERMLP